LKLTWKVKLPETPFGAKGCTWTKAGVTVIAESVGETEAWRVQMRRIRLASFLT
jgi:hypothetical protein